MGDVLDPFVGPAPELTALFEEQGELAVIEEQLEKVPVELPEVPTSTKPEELTPSLFVNLMELLDNLNAKLVAVERKIKGAGEALGQFCAAKEDNLKILAILSKAAEECGVVDAYGIYSQMIKTERAGIEDPSKLTQAQKDAVASFKRLQVAFKKGVEKSKGSE